MSFISFFTRIRVALLGAAFLLIATIWIIVLWRINFEHRMEIDSIIRQNASFTRAIEESVRNDMQAIDTILVFLKAEYEKHGFVTDEMLTLMKSARHIPIVHISFINEQGIIFRSILPQLISLNVSRMEYFQAFRQRDYNTPYFAKPVIGMKTKKWLFHISRRLNKPDGSMAGAINIGIDPAYFAKFFSQIPTGKDYSIAIIGKDGFVRIQQTPTTTEVGKDIRNEPFFSRLQRTEQGSFVDTTIPDLKRRIFTYRTMHDYPLIVAMSISETEALSSVHQRKVNYRWGGLLGSLAVVVMLLLLMRMFQQRINAEDALRQANEDLERTVANRTEELKIKILELQNALAEIKTLRGIVPICSYCKKIRDDNGYWNQVEKYVSEHTDATFSHGICPTCYEKAMKGVES